MELNINWLKSHQTKVINLKDLKRGEMGFKQGCKSNKSINIRYREGRHHKTIPKPSSFAMLILLVGA